MAEVAASVAGSDPNVKVMFNYELPFLKRAYHTWPPLVLPLRPPPAAAAAPAEHAEEAKGKPGAPAKAPAPAKTPAPKMADARKRVAALSSTGHKRDLFGSTMGVVGDRALFLRQAAAAYAAAAPRSTAPFSPTRSCGRRRGRCTSARRTSR